MWKNKKLMNIKILRFRLETKFKMLEGSMNKKLCIGRVKFKGFIRILIKKTIRIVFQINKSTN